jgi:hypothetical protein
MKFTKALNIINSAYAQDDSSGFKDMIYGFSLGQFWASKTHSELFVMLKKKVEMNPQTFLEFMDNPDREMETVINMAIEGAGGITGEMKKEGDSYYLGEKYFIGASLKEAKAFFRGNIDQYEVIRDKFILPESKKKDGKKESKVTA